MYSTFNVAAVFLLLASVGSLALIIATWRFIVKVVKPTKSRQVESNSDELYFDNPQSVAGMISELFPSKPIDAVNVRTRPKVQHPSESFPQSRILSQSEEVDYSLYDSPTHLDDERMKAVTNLRTLRRLENEVDHPELIYASTDVVDDFDDLSPQSVA